MINRQQRRRGWAQVRMQPLCLLLVMLVCLLLCGCFKQQVTRAQYDTITTGMTYDEVEKLIGVPGTEVVAREIPGVPGMIQTTTAKTYTWVNPDASQMTAVFVNKKLVKKLQTRLK